MPCRFYLTALMEMRHHKQPHRTLTRERLQSPCGKKPRGGMSPPYQGEKGRRFTRLWPRGNDMDHSSEISNTIRFSRKQFFSTSFCVFPRSVRAAYEQSTSCEKGINRRERLSRRYSRRFQTVCGNPVVYEQNPGSTNQNCGGLINDGTIQVYSPSWIIG